jgi:hypothetical protein
VTFYLRVHVPEAVFDARFDCAACRFYKHMVDVAGWRPYIVEACRQHILRDHEPEG